jgi:transcriptional regulator with PAS, ATPase and Fis domain
MNPAPRQEMLLGMAVLLKSTGLHEVLAMAERVANVAAPVMITGETGSGKEMVARAIHHYSLRCNKPWIDVNCGALPDHLVESELFGYEKGAFSGAENMKPGFFEMAHGGTLFLDEVGELDARMQVKLLRVLDGVPYYRLGGVRKVTVDVRVVAATSRNLEAEVEGGTFRRDLFYRLAAVHLRVPALRQRPDDIAPLAEFFLHNNHPGMTLSAATAEALRKYPWPGNVRELRNVITHAALFGACERIEVTDLPREFCDREAAPLGPTLVVTEPFILQPNSGAPVLEEVEKNLIFSTLSQTAGHRQKAARILGISRRTLSRKLKAYGSGSKASL